MHTELSDECIYTIKIEQWKDVMEIKESKVGISVLCT